MLRSIWRGALGAVVWGAMAVGAVAQTNVPQTPSNYKSPSGAYVLGGAVNLFGTDGVSGAECLVGLTATCQLSIGSGSFIIGKVGIDQTTPGTTNGVVVNSAPAGSIYDLGTGASPGAYTVNNYLAQLVTDPLSSGTNVIGYVLSGAGFTVAGTGTFNIQGLETSGSATTGQGARFMGKDASGTAQDLTTDANGSLRPPRSGPGTKVITKTNLTANTSTTICPATANVIATEVYFTAAGVGISLTGGTLTQAAVGTTAGTTPDYEALAAGTDYIPPVGSTNAFTAYGAAGVVSCIQYTAP